MLKINLSKGNANIFQALQENIFDKTGNFILPHLDLQFD